MRRGWTTIRLGQALALSQNGCSARHSTEGEPTVVLRLADVSPASGVNANGFREVLLPAVERERYRLEPDALLAFRVNGSRWITGQAVRYARTEPFAFCDHFIRIRTKPELLNSRMAELLFRAPSVRDQIERGMVTTAGQNTISQKTLSELEVPLPPLNERE